MTKRMWAVLAASAVALVLPASGVSRQQGGTLNL